MGFSRRPAVALLLMLAFVSACSGASEDNELTATPNPNIQQTTSGEDTSAIAGVWDDSHNDNGAVDVLYWVINADGTFADVDYLGDGYLGSNENCYHYFRGRVTNHDTDGYLFDTGGSDIATIRPNVAGGTILDYDLSVVAYYLRVINGELAILDDSNGQPTRLLSPVPGGLDPSIPECPPESG